jgi:soluble lytic murein transglycosylase
VITFHHMHMWIFIFVILLSPLTANASDTSAVRAAAKKNYHVKTSTATGYTLKQWYKLRQSDNIRFRDGADFIKNHPDYPDLKTIQKKMEKSISSNIPSQELIGWFNKHAPVTATGMKHYLNALLSVGNTAIAMQTLKNWWPNAVIAPNDQDDLIKKFGKYLGSQDHERRLRSIIHDKHYTASRRIAKQLGGGYPQLVEAKIGLIENKSNVNALIAKVPPSLRNNEALMLARAQWRRKNDQNDGAINILSKAPAYNRLSNPSAWWKERHIMARRLMEEKKWGSAYKLVSDHRQKEGVSFAQAEFVAGWIALQKIGKPWEAFQHFERLFNAVKSPISRARGSYWAGVASDALGHPEIAMQWYQVAAKYQTTFYGQMAANHINLPLGLITATPIQITSQSRQQFRSNPLISAAMLLKQAGQNRDAKRFLNTLGKGNLSGKDYRILAELSSSLGFNDVAVRVAKSAERAGYIMPKYLFPVLPEAKKKGYATHPAFIHGIIRQESAFDQHAKSHAGALGLMQLMPPTAKETAGKLGLPYNKSRLTNDPAYNMSLGAAYIAQMLKRFDGNRTLAIASYNAGPGRVSGWLKEFGDPRDPKINEFDWIEGIPVYETRNYVQRVTEALNVYAHMIR